MVKTFNSRKKKKSLKSYLNFHLTNCLKSHKFNFCKKTLAISKMENKLARAKQFWWTAQFSKVSSRITRSTELAFSHGQMGALIKEIGSKINSTDTEYSSGQMEGSIKEIICTERRTGKVNLSGHQAKAIKENGPTEKCTV